MKYPSLFSPLTIGSYQLSHRVVMAPLTRMRAEKPSLAPRPLNARYYEQRATPGGLIIAEASPVMAAGRGNPATPGIYSQAQIAGWRGVVDAVHAKGYGAYGWAFSFGVFQPVFEFGMGSALQRQVSETWTKADRDGRTLMTPSRIGMRLPRTIYRWLLDEYHELQAIDGGSAADNRASLDVARNAALRGDDGAIPNLAMTHDARLSRKNYVVTYIG